jgi:hypothetical protein
VSITNVLQGYAVEVLAPTLAGFGVVYLYLRLCARFGRRQ